MAEIRRKVEFIGIDGAKHEINLRHAKFIDTFLANGYKSVEAYLEVFDTNSRATARREAYKVLDRPEVKEYLAVRRKEAFAALHIDAERIIEELAKVGFVPVESDKVPPQVKVQALDKLSKIFGLYETKKEEAPQEIHIKIEE